MPKDEVDPEDPMELVGIQLPRGEVIDESEMTEKVIEEYLLEGYDRERLLRLFRDPFFRMTHDIFVRHGEAWVVSAIDRVIDRWSSPAI